jgi:hypothetical protein
MALGSIPPWLDVKPSDFVHAAAMGAEAGLQVAKMRQAAEESAANRGQRASEHSAEMELRQFERQQQMQMRAEEIQAQREKSRGELQARMDYNTANLELRKKDEKDKTDQQVIQNKRLQADLDERIRKNAAAEENTTPEDLTTKTLNGKTFQLRGGKWYHIPEYKSPTDTITETIPAAEPKEAVPAQPAGTGFLGTGLFASPAQAASPAIPGHGEMKRTRHVPQNLDPTAGTAPLPGIPDIGTPALSIPAMPTFTAAPKNKSDRKTGETYMTPKGPHTWNGDAWEAYAPPSHDEKTVPDLPPVEGEVGTYSMGGDMEMDPLPDEGAP